MNMYTIHKAGFLTRERFASKSHCTVCIHTFIAVSGTHSWKYSLISPANGMSAALTHSFTKSNRIIWFARYSFNSLHSPWKSTDLQKPKNSNEVAFTWLCEIDNCHIKDLMEKILMAANLKSKLIDRQRKNHFTNYLSSRWTAHTKQCFISFW